MSSMGEVSVTIYIYCLQFLWNMEANMYLDEEGKQKIVSQLRNEILTVTGIWLLSVSALEIIFSMILSQKEIFINFKVVIETPATWSVAGATNHSLVRHWLVWFLFPCYVPVVHIATFTAKENSNNSTSCLISVFLVLQLRLEIFWTMQLGDE